MNKFEIYIRRIIVIMVCLFLLFIIWEIAVYYLSPINEAVLKEISGKTENNKEEPVKPGGKEVKESATETKEKYIALTFDDGPHQDFTQKLLDVFEQENIKVTFFVVGKQVRKYPELLQKIHNSGHEIGNHTFSHPLLTQLSFSDILKELNEGKAEIKKAINIDVNLFRPPSGRYNDVVVDAAESSGFKTIIWSLYPADYGCTDSNIVKNIVVNGAKDGDIVLMHSGIPATLKALPEIISKLKGKGFSFKTVSELIELRGMKDNPIIKSFPKRLSNK